MEITGKQLDNQKYPLFCSRIAVKEMGLPHGTT
jgi:hypothetical protein